jgi:hypothetical protein
VGLRVAGRLLPAWLCSTLGWLNFAVLFLITSIVIFLFWKSACVCRWFFLFFCFYKIGFWFHPVCV